jgi:hypothetical protein
LRKPICFYHPRSSTLASLRHTAPLLQFASRRTVAFEQHLGINFLSSHFKTSCADCTTRAYRCVEKSTHTAAPEVGFVASCHCRLFSLSLTGTCKYPSFTLSIYSILRFIPRKILGNFFYVSLDFETCFDNMMFG